MDEWERRLGEVWERAGDLAPDELVGRVAALAPLVSQYRVSLAHYVAQVAGDGPTPA